MLKPSFKTYIYVIKTPAGEYVGKTGHIFPENRLQEHLENARNGKKTRLYLALQASPNAWSFEVIGRYNGAGSKQERAEIKRRNTFNNGLNETAGGEGTPQNAPFIITETDKNGVILDIYTAKNLQHALQVIYENAAPLYYNTASKEARLQSNAEQILTKHANGRKQFKTAAGTYLTLERV